MGSVALLQSLKEGILGQVSVKTIYGEPISAHGKTIIPVAKVIYAYGAGAGTAGLGDASARSEGGGGGGAARVIPLGVIEVSEQQTRFIPITSRKKLAGVLLAGIAFGMLLGWRGLRSR
ncbi:MAG: spore germination protein GerW family protein [Terriglobales bacterium]